MAESPNLPRTVPPRARCEAHPGPLSCNLSGPLPVQRGTWRPQSPEPHRCSEIRPSTGTTPTRWRPRWPPAETPVHSSDSIAPTSRGSTRWCAGCWTTRTRMRSPRTSSSGPGRSSGPIGGRRHSAPGSIAWPSTSSSGAASSSDSGVSASSRDDTALEVGRGPRGAARALARLRVGDRPAPRRRPAGVRAARRRRVPARGDRGDAGARDRDLEVAAAPGPHGAPAPSGAAAGGTHDHDPWTTGCPTTSTTSCRGPSGDALEATSAQCPECTAASPSWSGRRARPSAHRTARRTRICGAASPPASRDDAESPGAAGECGGRRWAFSLPQLAAAGIALVAFASGGGVAAASGGIHRRQRPRWLRRPPWP